MAEAVYLIDRATMTIAGNYTRQPGPGRINAYVTGDRNLGPLRVGDKVEPDPDMPGDFLRVGDFR